MYFQVIQIFQRQVCFNCLKHPVQLPATAETGDDPVWLLSPFINRAVASNKWEAAKCQDKLLTNTAKTCDIYLMLGQFKEACSILKGQTGILSQA